MTKPKYKLNDFVVVNDPDNSGLVVLNIEKIMAITDKNGTKIIYHGGIWNKLKEGWGTPNANFDISEERMSGFFYKKTE